MLSSENKYRFDTFVGGVCGVFGSGNELFLYPPKASARMIAHRWDPVFHHARGLLARWHHIFADVQRDMRDPEAGGLQARRAVLAMRSTQYRAELHDFLQKTMADVTAKDKVLLAELKQRNIGLEAYIKYLQVLQLALHLLHLTETCFLDVHDNLCAQMVAFMQRLSNPPAEGGAFWPTARKLAVQGRLNELAKLVEQDGSLRVEHPEAVRECIDVLLTMPLRNPRTSFPDEEALQHALQVWKERVEKLLMQSSLPQPMLQLCRILRGDEEELRNTAETWMELFLGYLLYRYSASHLQGISELMSFCIHAFFEAEEDEQEPWDMETSLSGFELCVVYIVQRSIPKVLQIVNQLIDVNWFSAHLIDLLHHAQYDLRGLVVIEDVEDNLRFNDAYEQQVLRETFILQYAETLMYHRSLWQLAAEYLASCHFRGFYYLEQLVQCQPIAEMSRFGVIKLLAICDQYNLTQQKNTVLNQLARVALDKGMYGSSIRYFVQAGSHGHVASIARFLAQKLLHAEFCGDRAEVEAFLERIASVIDGVHDVSLLSDLKFLSKLRDLFLLSDEAVLLSSSSSSSSISSSSGDPMWQVIRASLEIIVRLLHEKIAPRLTWAALIRKAAALLKMAGKSTVLATKDVTLLMEALESVTSEYHRILFSSSSSSADQKAPAMMHVDGAEDHSEPPPKRRNTVAAN